MDTVVTGKVWVVGDGVTTDAMYPAFAMKLPVPEAARHVFYELRPGWTDEVSPGDIVVAGRNFGLGSSRPVAALFRELGVAALVAEEFNSLFLRNCINHGLPALTVPGVTAAFGDGAVMRLDFAAGWAEHTGSGLRLAGGALPPLVLDILAAGGVLPRLAREGYVPVPPAGSGS
ncbi:LeuD/DmdB family oxidoreductase small subunit [Streptomyces alanosinicus]|uniref:3-isopropylmalate dehydratase small subunit n=1 Tax=Streptomyces alanosinicus TaxID=68171 RepID=A0A919D3Q1_9ACTN|nr:3-isopropylmalate dehydratase [Streptomyces alanosinicus]GHE05092.1 3-isopropylmalate dehydratase small subunit [Streptomyces alanosinicus]